MSNDWVGSVVMFAMLCAFYLFLFWHTMWGQGRRKMSDKLYLPPDVECGVDLRVAKELLLEFVLRDGEPCRYDHSGFCQEHLSDKPCLVVRARKFLERG